MADYAHQLKEVPLFAALSDAHLQRIANSARERTYEPGTSIVSAGETGQGFYFIVTGQVQVRRGDRIVATRRAGDYFGELALLRDEPRMATVIAMERTVCLVLTRWDFKGILEANPAIAVPLLETVARRVDDAGAR